jgi:hypothetical protein
MAESTELKVGNWVEIGGRTMLRPGFSLVGLTGILFKAANGAPAGTMTVAIDWPRHGYTPESGYDDGSLPLFVNIPTEFLTAIPAPDEPQPPSKPEPPSRPKLRLV